MPWGLQRGLVSPASVKALSGPWGARDQGVRAKGGAEAREARSASPSREWAADRGLSNFGCPRAAQGAGVPGFRGCFSIGASRAHPHLLKLIPFPDPPLPPALSLAPPSTHFQLPAALGSAVITSHYTFLERSSSLLLPV